MSKNHSMEKIKLAPLNILDEWIGKEITVHYIGENPRENGKLKAFDEGLNLTIDLFPTPDGREGLSIINGKSIKAISLGNSNNNKKETEVK